METVITRMADTKWHVFIAGIEIGTIEHIIGGHKAHHVVFAFNTSVDPSLTLNEMKEIVAHMEKI